MKKSFSLLWAILALAAASGCGVTAPGDSARPQENSQGSRSTSAALAGALVQDFTTGTYPVATYANATNPTSTLDARGATKVSYASAGPGQFTGLQVVGTWDLSGSDLFALDVGFDTTETNTRVAVFFCFDAGGGFTNYAAATDLVSGVRKPHRVAIPIPKSSLSVTGTANWAAVQRIEVRLHTTYPGGTTSPDAMYVYGLLANVASRAKVILSFDDGAASVRSKVFPITSAAGIRGTLYLNGQYIGSSGNLTLAQVQEIYAAGWDVANHTIDHTPVTESGEISRSGSIATFVCGNSADVHGLGVGDTVTISGADQPEYNGAHVVASTPSTSTFTFSVSGSPPTPATGWMSFPKNPESVVRNKIQQQTDWAMANGLTRGIKHFAYPQGYFSDDGISLLQSIGFQTGRTVNIDPFPTYIWPTYTGLNDAYQIPAYTIQSSTTASEVMSYVDDAVQKGASLHLYGHNVVDQVSSSGDVSTAVFQAIVDGLKARSDAGLLDVVTISEWYASLGPGPGPVTLSSLSLNPGTVVGGAASRGTVTLSGAAPAGGIAVGLASDKASATVPAMVTVAEGSTSAAFAVTTSVVAATTSATIMASYGGNTRTAALSVTPVPVPTLTSLSSTSGTTAGGRSVTVNGSGFSAGAIVTFGGVPAPVTSLTAATIAVTTPAHSAGPVDVTVTNPDGQAVTAAGVYTFALPAPTGLTATGGSQRVSLAWNAVPGASAYDVLRAASLSGPYSLIGALGGTTYVDTGLADGTRWYYRVQATDEGTTSGRSSTVNAWTVPRAPTGLVATPGTRRIALLWNAATGASSYRVYRATVPGGPYSRITSTSGTTYTNSSLTTGRTYYYVVQAINAAGTSANSTEVRATAR